MHLPRSLKDGKLSANQVQILSSVTLVCLGQQCGIQIHSDSTMSRWRLDVRNGKFPLPLRTPPRRKHLLEKQLVTPAVERLHIPGNQQRQLAEPRTIVVWDPWQPHFLAADITNRATVVDSLWVQQEVHLPVHSLGKHQNIHQS